MRSFATATEEMPNSIGEIGRQVQEPEPHSQGGRWRRRTQTDNRITKRVQAATRIGDATRVDHLDAE